MRTPPVPPVQAAPEEPLLCDFEPQPAPGAFPRETLRSPGRKAVTPRVEYYYRQLKALPRRVRRALARRYARSLAGVALLLALGQLPALAATIDVDGASCTLVGAIKAANTDATSGGCPAGSGADTLVLTPNSTHTLTTVEDRTFGPTGLPLVTSQITIAGNDGTIERGAGAPEFRILAVGDAGNLTLQALTVSGGHAAFVEGAYYSGSGGGVFNRYAGRTTTGSSARKATTSSWGKRAMTIYEDLPETMSLRAGTATIASRATRVMTGLAAAMATTRSEGSRVMTHWRAATAAICCAAAGTPTP